MTILWALARAEEVPEGDAWLGPRERSVQEALRIPKRRSDWRMGRLAAKRLLTDLVGVHAFHRIQVVAADDGAPEAFVDGLPLDVSLSISHRGDLAVAATRRGGRVGCDLERVEPRTARFIGDYFTKSEREAIDRAEPSLRVRQVALTWSAKESALKALRVGLRRDTRRVEVAFAEPGAKGDVWSDLVVTLSPENRSLRGRWRQLGGSVLTIVEDPTPSDVARHDEER